MMAVIRSATEFRFQLSCQVGALRFVVIAWHGVCLAKGLAVLLMT